jgi:hypothetical protein
MRIRDFAVVLAGIAAVAVPVGCSASPQGQPQGQPDERLVEKAAGLAFGTSATCDGPGEYDYYDCRDNPPVCGISTNDGGTGCWQTKCDVAVGATTRDGDMADFYYCWRYVPTCQSVTGGCPGDEICIVGHGSRLAIDGVRTAALPYNGGNEPSCPYHDEQYGQ